MPATILPPPPDTNESDIAPIPRVPRGYKKVRCPACEETHFRPCTVREEPLRSTPRTDTVPVPRR